MNSLYSMVIQWSDEDGCFVVFLPELAGLVMQPCTDGQTYEEAARHGQEAIASLIEWFEAEGKPLPHPKTMPQQPLSVA
ncbi:MAG: type II toxin-antitoxin system HicB family antitoxin [Oscillatoriaceae cyanobacterium Prado104]|jgi:predicted RNase H-like HicB family nuclease|nr:type II toxin-antitoxin system HicB family antitoxin [Oscillatoriaceae cyanobacterium Prado104]